MLNWLVAMLALDFPFFFILFFSDGGPFSFFFLSWHLSGEDGAAMGRCGLVVAADFVSPLFFPPFSCQTLFFFFLPSIPPRSAVESSLSICRCKRVRWVGTAASSPVLFFPLLFSFFLGHCFLFFFFFIFLPTVTRRRRIIVEPGQRAMGTVAADP